MTMASPAVSSRDAPPPAAVPLPPIDVSVTEPTPPTSGPPPKSIPIRPPPRPLRSNFDLEPNPFEQSFSASSSSIRTAAHLRSPARESLGPSSNGSSDTQASSDGRSHTPERIKPEDELSPKPVLPPLASITSPADPSYSWFSSSSFANSLRSGPLSPAMLAGPQHQRDAQASQASLTAFDPANFRTGLTPRTGMTPGTGLTPLIGSGVAFPPPSPGTAAFINMMHGSGGANPSAMTPGTIAAITGALSANGNGNGQSNANSHVRDYAMHPMGQDDPSYATMNANAANAANTAANGLFLLSQAHQELTKREEAQRASSGFTGPTNGTSTKRGTKRKSDASLLPPPEPKLQTKRTKATGRKRADSFSMEDGFDDMEDFDDEDDEDLQADAKVRAGGHKKPETEEEKRRNFLERNRQGKRPRSVAQPPHSLTPRAPLQPRSSVGSARRRG